MGESLISMDKPKVCLKFGYVKLCLIFFNSWTLQEMCFRKTCNHAIFFTIRRHSGGLTFSLCSRKETRFLMSFCCSYDRISPRFFYSICLLIIAYVKMN